MKAGQRLAMYRPSLMNSCSKVAMPHVEDGYTAKLVASLFGISEYSVYRWGKIIFFILNKSCSIGRRLKPDQNCRRRSANPFFNRKRKILYARRGASEISSNIFSHQHIDLSTYGICKHRCRPAVGWQFCQMLQYRASPQRDPL
jgi:hypothetical protein